MCLFSISVLSNFMVLSIFIYGFNLHIYKYMFIYIYIYLTYNFPFFKNNQSFKSNVFFFYLFLFKSVYEVNLEFQNWRELSKSVFKIIVYYSHSKAFFLILWYFLILRKLFHLLVAFCIVHSHFVTFFNFRFRKTLISFMSFFCTLFLLFW